MSSTRPKFTQTIIGETPVTVNSPQNILLIGSFLSSGTATANTLYPNLTDVNVVNALFGRKSMIATMYKRIRAINTKSRIDIIPVTEPTSGASASTGTIEFSGTSTEEGTLKVVVGSAFNGTRDVFVPKGTTATALATLVESAYAGAFIDLPFSLSKSSATLTLTSTQLGTELNSTFLGVFGSVAGIGATITEVTGGAGNATVNSTTVSAIPDNVQYKYTLLHQGLDASLVRSLLESRFNAENIILDGYVIQPLVDTYANQITALSALNSRVLVHPCFGKVSNTSGKGVAIRELPSLATADFVAINTLKLIQDAPIADYVPVSTININDAYGGVALASLPFFNQQYPSLVAFPAGYEYTKLQIDALETAGGIVFQNTRDASRVTITRGVTTYKTNALGIPDDSFRSMNKIDQATEFRKLCNNRFYERFGAARLGGSTIRPSRAMVNVQSMRAFWLDVYIEASAEPFILTQEGDDERSFFLNNLNVTIDISTGIVRTTGQVPYVGQFNESLSTFAMAFNI